MILSRVWPALSNCVMHPPLADDNRIRGMFAWQDQVARPAGVNVTHDQNPSD